MMNKWNSTTFNTVGESERYRTYLYSPSSIWYCFSKFSNRCSFVEVDKVDRNSSVFRARCSFLKSDASFWNDTCQRMKVMMWQFLTFTRGDSLRCHSILRIFRMETFHSVSSLLYDLISFVKNWTEPHLIRYIQPTFDIKTVGSIFSRIG